MPKAKPSPITDHDPIIVAQIASSLISSGASEDESKKAILTAARLLDFAQDIVTLRSEADEAAKVAELA